MDARHYSRMVEVPQFSIPEIYVEQDDEEGGNGAQATTTTEGPLSPGHSRNPSTGPAQNDGSAVAEGSPSLTSPIQSEWTHLGTLAPSREGNTLSSSYGDGGDVGNSESRTGRPRGESSVSVQGVMDSLDSSAWGESIRRSFTQRRSQGS
jgi:voltage-dependent calcium channel